MVGANLHTPKFALQSLALLTSSVCGFGLFEIICMYIYTQDLYIFIYISVS